MRNKGNIVTMHISTFLAIILLSTACNSPAEGGSTPLGSEGPEIYKGPIIDMHIHASAEGDPMLGMTHPPTLRGKTYEGVTSAAEQRQKTMDAFHEHNIVKAMVSDGLLWGVDSSDTVLIGASSGGVDALREQHKAGNLQVIAEMDPFYAGILANDPSMMPYFGLAQELNIPVGFHIFPGGPNYGFHVMPEMLGGMRTYNASPLQLEDVLVRHPSLKVYIMHGGWPYVEDIKALMYAHPNVYVDIASIDWVLPREELYAYLKALIGAGFGDRIMFGSDQMTWPETIGIAVETVNLADFLTLQQKEDIFYDNAARFLGLTDEEIKEHKSR